MEIDTVSTHTQYNKRKNIYYTYRQNKHNKANENPNKVQSRRKKKLSATPFHWTRMESTQYMDLPSARLMFCRLSKMLYVVCLLVDVLDNNARVYMYTRLG